MYYIYFFKTTKLYFICVNLWFLKNIFLKIKKSFQFMFQTGMQLIA
jgi:hypothetical protein